MTEEEKQAIFKLREIIEYDKKHRLETIYDKEEIEFRNNIELAVDLVEKLQKENEELREITNGYNSLKKDSETFGGIPLIIADEKYFNDGIFTTNFIPKGKIKEKIEEYDKEIKTYEDKMLEITQREKHQAIENKDYIKYSCIISNFTDKIKLLEELLEEE